jgi:glucose dehydrogenase
MPHGDPFGPWRTGLAYWTMMSEAQTVVALRVLGMWGVLPASKRENHTMSAEKAPAFARAALAAGTAAAQGKSPDAVLQAAIRPIRRRTSANVKRLTKPRRPKA